jgi:murein L,D-transpeptidase YafK
MRSRSSPCALPAGGRRAAAAGRRRCRTADFVLVDKSDRVLTLFAGGKPYRNYAACSSAIARRPQAVPGRRAHARGRYTIDYGNPQSSYRLSLHISYPNAADRAYRRSAGRSPGGEIFIHGQPNWLPRPPPGDWTDGCIALSNAEIEELWQLVPDGTPIEIRP